MSNQEAFYSQLYQYIEKIANQVSDLRGSDTIKTGTIIQVLPGHYVVQLNEGNEQSSVKAIALNTSDLFSLQDYVYLMQATGSIENTYFIVGKVEQIQEDFLNLTLTERFTSSNELSGDLLKLNTKIEDLTILSDIKANRVFQIKGTFTCNKLNGENYGLKVSFNCGDQVIKTYNLDTNYFIGQPFDMTSQPQMRTILLDEVVLKSNFDNIIITTFGSNFTYSDITIASGSLLDINGIVNVSLSFKNKKDYFSLNGTEVDNSVKVSAEVEYEGAPLVAPGIQYYWLLKDDSIDENSEYYFSYAGEGWKCLNTYENVSGIGTDGTSLTLQIWSNGDNNITLSETSFPDFINTFKCIMKYQDIIVSSPEVTLYNYNKESFFVELESNIQPPLLILETDQVILSAVVEDENEKTDMTDYTCAYQWQVENENGDWEVVTKKEVSEGVFEDTFAFNEYNAEHILTKDWSKLTIVDQLLSNMEGDSSFYILHGEGEEITKNFRCVVRVYRKDDLLNFVSEDFSESMQVVSKVAIAAQLVSTTYYKYYISNTPYTLFPKLENGEGDWEGDWSISIKQISSEGEEYFVSQNWIEDSNLANWSSDDLQEFPSGKMNQDAYNYIIGKFAGNSQNGSYLYITSQEVWVEERLGKINFLRKDNWTIPALAKGYSNNGNYLDDKAVDKLNTFTHLTEGGLNKGLLYDENTGDLYINADFINTGALRVANNLGKEVLYADVDNGFVEVGGFTVDEYTLTSKNNNVGLNSNEATSSDAAIWVGQEGSEAYTKITHDGVLHAKGIIVEGNIEVKSSNTIATKKELEESSKQLSEDLDSAEKSWNKALEDQNKALLDELKVLDETTKKYINSIEQDLQNQIDGSISSWFYEGVPTLDNAPASTWKDEEKGAHLGDLYYDLKTGKCYRWAQEQNGDALEWKWVLVTDTDIALALENAAKAQATADGKITTFNGNNGTTLPPPPYQKGDLLVNAKENSSSDAQTYICVISKKVGESPSWEDWISIGNYATSSTLSAVENDLQSQIDARMSIWYYSGVPTVSNDPAKNWTTVELQKQHDKDLYYDLDTGRAYRWIYSASGNTWEEVLDIRITQALADAATAQATADGKITTYKWTGSLPDPGYQEGDLLVGAKKNDGDDAQTYLCITSTTKNDSASWDHWTPIGDYTTTTMLETMQAALQTQIDGSISVWYESGMPSLTNEPAKNWSDDEKLKHDRDLYYDIDTGYCYRWECNATSKNGKWTQIEDERIEQALADAADAQSTADGKITSFYGERPTKGYQYGDVWMEGETEAGTGKMYTCIVKNITGQLQDWKPVGDFVTGAEVEETIKATQDEIGELINDLDARVTASTYFSTSSLTTSSGTEIPAIVMKAKDDAGNGVMYFSTADLVINSDKLKLNHNGSTYTNGYLKINTVPLKLYNDGYMTINTTPIKLNYSNSKYSLQINTDNFKIDSDGDVTIIGKVTATSLEIDPDAAGKAGLATSSDLSEVSSVASQAQTAAAGAQSVANAANTTAANAKAAAAGAQTAASNAAKSANDAAGEAAAANTAATNASNSASQAQGSASQAATSASNAAKDAGEAKTTANTAAKDASDAKSIAGTAAKDASDAAKDASQAKTTADGAAKDASDAKGVADQAKGIADGAAKNASDAKDIADGAKDAADIAKNTADGAAKDASDAKDIADGAKDVADQAKEVADTAAKDAGDALKKANETSQAHTLLNQTVTTLQTNVQAATYFKVDTAKDWIYLKSKTEDTTSPGMIFFDTNRLVFNSDVLKLDHDGSGYSEGHLEIHSNNFNLDKNGNVKVKGEIYATALTIDGTLGVENLAANKYLSIHVNDGNSKYEGYKFSLSLGSVYTGAGVKFDKSMFRSGTDYVLSFKYKEVDSTGVATNKIQAKAIAGHCSGFVTEEVVYIYNGKRYSIHGQTWAGCSNTQLTYLASFTGEIEVQVYLRFQGGSDDDNLYIQPGRSSSTSYGQNLYCEIWDVKIEEGTIATGWRPATEDGETYFQIDPSSGNVTLKAGNLLSLSGSDIEINSGDFQLTTEGEITATKGKIGGFNITEKSLYSTAQYEVSPIYGSNIKAGEYKTFLTSNQLTCDWVVDTSQTSYNHFGWEVGIGGISTYTARFGTDNYNGGIKLLPYFDDRDWNKAKYNGTITVSAKNNLTSVTFPVVYNAVDYLMNLRGSASTATATTYTFFIAQEIGKTTFSIYQGTSISGTLLKSGVSNSTLSRNSIQLNGYSTTKKGQTATLKVSSLKILHVESTLDYVGVVEPFHDEGRLIIGGSVIPSLASDPNPWGMYDYAAPCRGPYIEFTPEQAILHYHSKLGTKWVFKNDADGTITTLKS